MAVNLVKPDEVVPTLLFIADLIEDADFTMSAAMLREIAGMAKPVSAVEPDDDFEMYWPAPDGES